MVLYLFSGPLPLLPLSLHLLSFVHIVKVEVGFSFGLRHFGPEPLLEDGLFVGQTLAQVSPVETV